MYFFFRERSSFIFHLMGKIIFMEKEISSFLIIQERSYSSTNFFGMTIFSGRLEKTYGFPCRGFRGHSHIESTCSLHQTDVNGWVGLELWCYNLTHEISIFVKILKKEIYIHLNKGKTENSFNIVKNQEFELITSCHFKKFNLSKVYKEQQFNFFKKFRAIASLPIVRLYFRFFFNKKKISQKIQ